VRFRYFDPAQQSTVEGEVHSGGDVAELVAIVGRLRTERAPAVEFSNHDGSSLVLGIAGEQAVLLWTAADGSSAHSLGESAGDGVVFDYFGSYTEMPATYAVPVADAVAAAGGYVESGAAPSEAGVLLALD
jgi:hypothetical protein